ncbi:hypothetical protein IIE26_05085 [Cytobacillus oceanisediminis]|uniref:hypothetical protein n=1 Tax=Cytobacillus oceanisediminis TaxID=665099 RepID=UPI0018647BE4|nr:hypothetical protein [Cytobacillus oceanisediminis]QOK28046.1 hypothetical protein IIE26_05085 [Cytobacillus oceanisediminis]
MKNYKYILDIFFRVLMRSFPLPGSNVLDLMDELKRSRTSIDEKIQKVTESLQETSLVIEELESELSERTKNLKVLQSEYERYSKLSEIEEEKAAALISQVESSLGKGKKSERWVNFWIGIGSGLIIFIAGLLLSPILTPLITQLFKFLSA